MFSKPLKELLLTEGEVDDVAVISMDSKGIDIRVRQGAQVQPSKSYLYTTRAVSCYAYAIMSKKKLLIKICITIHGLG
jgi:hypothetical protein